MFVLDARNPAACLVFIGMQPVSRLRGKGPAVRARVSLEALPEAPVDGIVAGDAAAAAAPEPQDADLQAAPSGAQEIDSVPVEEAAETFGDEAGEAPLVGGRKLTSSFLKQVMAQAIRGENVDQFTFAMLMQKLADLFGVDVGELHPCKERIRGLVDKVARKEISRQILEKATQQNKNKKQKVEAETRALGSAQVLMAYLLTWACPKQPSDERKSPEGFSRENLRDILLNSFAAAQSEVAETRRAAIVLMAIFEERHQSNKKHFHAAVRLSQATRWGPWRRVLQEQHGICMDFSMHSQGGYHAAIRYCFVPTLKKTEAELDPEPLLFAAASEGGVHPPLYEAMNKSFSAKAGFIGFIPCLIAV